MSIKRTSLLAGTAFATMASAPVAAAPGSILVETKLADPDPGYVAPPPERTIVPKRQKAKDPTLDEALENLGRVTGEAALIMQRRAQSQPSTATVEARARAQAAELERQADEAERAARN